jgi:hypothetical protein
MKFLKSINWLNFGYRGGTLALILVLALTMIACSTTWLVDLESYLPVAVGAATGIVTILASAGVLGPVVPVEVAAAETAVTEGLNLLCGVPVNNQCNPTSLIGSYNSAPTADLLTKIQAVLATVQTNLQSLLSLVHVKSAALQATITAAISLVLTTIAAIVARIAPVASAVITGSAKQVKAAMAKTPRMPISSTEFKSQFNRIVSNGGFSTVAIP